MRSVTVFASLNDFNLPVAAALPVGARFVASVVLVLVDLVVTVVFFAATFLVAAFLVAATLGVAAAFARPLERLVVLAAAVFVLALVDLVVVAMGKVYHYICILNN